jgi:hypothetical protein
LPGDFQFEARLPYGYEIERNISSDNTETTHRSNGLGDIELALYKQIAHQRRGRPDVLLGLRWKGTTGKDPFTVGVNVPTLGNGFHSLQPSLTLAKASDPAVFFGGFSYTRSLADDKTIVSNGPQGPTTSTGRVAPGDTFSFNLGGVLALNSQASASVSYQQGFTRSSSLNDVRIPGSFLNTGLLQLGGSYMYAKGKTLDLTIGIGLTRDSPDFQFTVALPFRFALKRPHAAAVASNAAKAKSPAESGGDSSVAVAQ